jgi:hypothetical protein
MMLDMAAPIAVTRIQVLEPDTSELCHPLTPYSLTLVLAYLHYYTPEKLPKGRFLSPTHLRMLAQWIGQPAPQIRSIRQHRQLAAHIAILYAAGFLSMSGSRIMAQPGIVPWLHAPFPDKIAHLQKVIGCPPHWTKNWIQAITELGLQDTLPLDHITYLQQSLARQCVGAMETNNAVWRDSAPDEMWQISLPPTLPLWLHFDLRQLGEWSPEQPLTCTPLTVALAVQRGYGPDTIQWLLETATGQSLPPAQQIQLHQWCRRAHVYRLRTVQLLTVPQPDYLEPMRRRKEFRSAILEQLSPRHIAVHSDIIPAVDKWLAAHGYPLYQHQVASENASVETELTYQWLGLRLLVGLGNIIPLPYPSPHSLLDSLSEQLTETTKSELEATVILILEQLREAIHGRDAFFPSQKPIDPTLIATLQKTIIQETTLTITYQALGDRKPSARQIQPLHLEKRGELFYLHAYCFRAETNLTFVIPRSLRRGISPICTGEGFLAPKTPLGMTGQFEKLRRLL